MIYHFGNFQVSGPLEHDGIANALRPLSINDDGKLYAAASKNTTGDLFNIGQTLTDVTIPTSAGPMYVSLKFGPTVTFINAGVNNKNMFPKNAFIQSSSSLFGPIGTKIINLFAIKPDLFIEIFNKYDKTLKKHSVLPVYDNVTDIVNKEDLLYFIKTVIGYGYVLIHKFNSGEIHYYDLRTPEALEKFVGKHVNLVKITYPAGDRKRMDIVISLDNIQLKINIRSKDGGLYPTHIMCDYTINKEFGL